MIKKLVVNSLGYWVAIILGSLAVFSGYFAYLIACVASSWECSGDIAGGIMMLYGIVGIPLALVLGICSSIYLIIFLLSNRKSISFAHKFGLVIYGFIFFLGTHRIVYVLWQS